MGLIPNQKLNGTLIINLKAGAKQVDQHTEMQAVLESKETSKKTLDIKVAENTPRKTM